MNDGSDDEPTVRLPAAALRSTAGGMPPPAGEPASMHALPAGVRIAEFEIRGIIGEGGFSIVYLAWDQSLHRNVALKEYIPFDLAVRDGTQRVTARSSRHRETFEVGLKSFINEARLLASFDHHSLVKVHRFWEESGTAYMVMPWYQGPTLKEVLGRATARPGEAWLRRLLDPLTEALAVLHEQNCFHRDIAPDNILLIGPAQVPLLLDFGAARRVIGSLTHDLTAILKQGYAPLEQYGEIPGMRQGAWTDVYALAAVVHYAIRGETPPPAVARLVTDNYRPLAASPPAGFGAPFLEAIDRALVVRPEQRTASIAEFRRQIGLDGAPVPAAPPPEAVAERAAARDAASTTSAPAARPPKTATVAPSAGAPGRRRVVGAVVGGVGVAALAALAVRFWPTGQTATPPVGIAPAPPPVAIATSPPPAVAPPAVVPPAVAPPEVASPAIAPPPAAPPPAAPPTVAPPTVAPPAATPATPEPATASPAVVAADAARERDIAAEKAARRSADAAVASLQRLAQAEARDVSAALRASRDRLDRAQAESSAGRHEQAAALAREANAGAIRSLNGLVDELVKGYAQLAEQAAAAGEPEIAKQALERSKRVAALRR